MQLPRELYESGGITSLQDPRQGYFLGKLVKKITKPIKKIVKSPIGKAALAGAALYGLGGGTFMGRGLPFLKSGGGFSLANLGSNLGIGSIGQGGKFAFDGPLAGLFSTDGKFSLGKTALTGLGAQQAARAQQGLTAQQQLLSRQALQPLEAAQQFGSGVTGLIAGYPGRDVIQPPAPCLLYTSDAADE